MNNNIFTIQEMLMREMRRLDDDKLMATEGQNEISRSNALSNNALTYIKSINMQLRIKEVAEKTSASVKELNKELGIDV